MWNLGNPSFFKARAFRRAILHYRVLEKIGEGGMGVVYKALDTHLQRPVAIKVLPPEIVADRERRRRFVQEARAASALNHLNIVHVYDIDQTEGTDFLAKGAPRRWLEDGRKISVAGVAGPLTAWP